MSKIVALAGPDPRRVPWVLWATIAGVVGFIWWGTLQPRTKRIV